MGPEPWKFGLCGTEVTGEAGIGGSLWDVAALETPGLFLRSISLPLLCHKGSEGDFPLPGIPTCIPTDRQGLRWSLEGPFPRILS